MGDLGLLILRLVSGGLLAGHGAQKLFGSFGGHGLEGTGGWFESLGLRPGERWATMAGLSEFGGGLSTALGAFSPLGSIATLSAMTMAALKVHGDKPIWATEGGAELPATNLAIATALLVTGPGRYSLDRAFGLRLPAWFVALAAAGATVGVLKGLTSEPEQAAAGQGGAPAAQSSTVATASV